MSDEIARQLLGTLYMEPRAIPAVLKYDSTSKGESTVDTFLVAQAGALIV